MVMRLGRLENRPCDPSARVRVCPGSPRCLFSFYRHCTGTGTGRTRDTDTRVQYRNVPCVSRLTPVSFYRCFLPPVSFTGAFSSGVGSPTGIKQVPV